ncbi:MAG: rplW [Candidatus Saccharibacteria bacterium]|nr:rplW [Candidatus Saccharibacteria bacterium]
MGKHIVLEPRMNEKTYGLSDKGVYVFNIANDVNKHSVARAVESQFDVKVTAVNILNVKGKAKRTISLTGKRMKNAEGKRPDTKKAYVTLAEGNRLPIFAAIEEAEQKEEATQAKIDKAAEKAAKKEGKK